MDAGQLGAVTIATNMAGRGVDIKLGDGVRELGGLYVLGTERHEARRIDNQLRGRSGRQGDPGETRFYLSGQDDLVRLFAGDRIYNIMDRFKLPDDQPMEAKILSNQIEGAQKKVEEQNFVARKNVLKYDDVMNMQRMVIYEQRREVLEGEDLSEEIRRLDRRGGRAHRRRSTPRSEYAEEWDLDGARRRDGGALRHRDHGRRAARGRVDLIARGARRGVPRGRARRLRRRRRRSSAPELMRELERFVVLQVVDTRWREHLENMDYLREGVHLRAMAQKDPLVEYRREGHAMFDELGRAIREEVVLHALPRASSTPEDADERARSRRAHGGQRRRSPTSTSRSPAPTRSRAAGGGATATATAVAGGAPASTDGAGRQREHENIGRNDPCWCGSGKKFKQCHGA